ncbi:radical SAM protein [candidate division TA06 bacterium SM1_40]|uniref:Radical SAM protein n=2 Tax=Bacteria division TA06 TaxID=1156500 RepID=A0A0S8JAG2_UNCT6|nr:MAG: radical SAM protein [candidate division TA06 bacterium SM23_40]KPL05836.1 MAG: radical SAM protein [candidate division TA06 bacterium SM1_40]
MPEKRRRGYQELVASGELARRLERAKELMNPCRLCPRVCEARRLEGEQGTFCGGGKEAVISSIGPHFGEEPPLVGHGGSGTIFFTGCSLGCLFCQNYTISHLGEGMPIDARSLAKGMLDLQSLGCHNINFVTPTHVVPQILEALLIAAGDGLSLPLVYNCGGYESLETLAILDGVIDIYMPDAKYWDPEIAERYSNAPDYPEVMRAALQEMHRQVGDLEIVSGIAERGLLVRHLVMPNEVASTQQVVEFIADRLSKKTYVNIMEQYRPCYRAREFPLISRRLTMQEYDDARRMAERAGLHRGF